MLVKYISKPIEITERPETYFIGSDGDSEYIMSIFDGEWFYDEDFVDTILSEWFSVDTEKKTVSFISKDISFGEYQEQYSDLDYSSDKIADDIEARITEFKNQWNIEWEDEYFEDSSGDVLNPFEGEKRTKEELFS